MTEDSAARVLQLWRERPRSRFLWWSVGVMTSSTIVVFTTIGLGSGGNLRRLENLKRFLGQIVPHDQHGEPIDFGLAWWDWAGDLMGRGGGFDAAVATLAISIVSIVLAMGLALLFTLPASRNFANPEPFLPEAKVPTAVRRNSWRAVVVVTRAVLILLRAIPEYIWAFLLIGVLGANAWPAILALALHNAGILGRLTSEIVENVELQVPSALRAIGAGRKQITMFSLLPQNFTRLLLYFFYRWETCVREATVLGLLGIASLGFLIADARVKFFRDDLFFLILVGASIVVLGDFVSLLARVIARRA